MLYRLLRLINPILGLFGRRVERDPGTLRYVGAWQQQDDGTWKAISAEEMDGEAPRREP